MHAFLVCGQNQDRVGEKIENLLQSRLGEIANKNRLDLSPSPKKESKLPTLTIEDVRFIANWLSQQSSKSRAVIVHQAQSLTIPAQQALLKTLEEPGENNYIILTSDSEFSLLSTIRSRCKIIRITDDQGQGTRARGQGEILQTLQNISVQSPAERIVSLYAMLSEFSGKKFSPYQGSIPRPEALKFLEDIISSLHHPSSIIHHPSSAILQIACLAHRRLKNNLNVQLALQQFILDIPKM